MSGANLPQVQDPGARQVDVTNRGPQFFRVVPTDLKEAMEIAKLIASSNLCPTAFRGKPGDVLIVMMQSAELEIPYFQGLQNIAVINGRPTVWGDLAVALIQRSPKLEFLTRAWDEATQTATVRVKRKGFPGCVQTFSMQDAQRAKLAGKDTYQQFPQRMCMWRALTWAIRNEFADVLKGMSIAEEAMDMPPGPPIEAHVSMPQAIGSLVQDFLAPPAGEKRAGAAAHASGPPVPAGPAVYVEKAEAHKGVSKANGKPWTAYKIAFGDGSAGTTWKLSEFEIAQRAQAEGLPVLVTIVDGKTPSSKDITSLVLAPIPEPEQRTDDAAAGDEQPNPEQ